MLLFTKALCEEPALILLYSCYLQKIYISIFYSYVVVHNQLILEDLLLLENSMNGKWVEGVLKHLWLN
jgi:hypothetical protein